jgi:hypothetical protein
MCVRLPAFVVVVRVRRVGVCCSDDFFVVALSLAFRSADALYVKNRVVL